MRLELVKDLGRHLRAGHPWVFRKALEKIPKGAEPGTIVDLWDGKGFAARGYLDPLSPISVRVLTRDANEAIDAAFWRRRVERAAELRRRFLAPDVDGYRLIHGESDGLPGVVLDVYAGWGVCKLYSAGLRPFRAAIAEAAREAVRLSGIWSREEIGREDGDDEEAGAGAPLWGEPPPELIEIHEHDVKLLVDVRRGQKTGLFVDQRENRQALRRYVADGASVLNCFGYTGGFSLHAAREGAAQVTTVDLSASAIALCKRNMQVNGLAARSQEVVGDVFELLGAWKKEGRTWDVVVLDPPAFAKSQKAVESAIAGYANLNRLALGVLAPGGVLVTASCSARVAAEQFFGAVKEAAFKTRVDLQLLEARGQPPDHPVSLQFPEGRYLKLFVLRRMA